MKVRYLSPSHWAGYTQPVVSQVFVCGACPNPQECSDENQCARHVEAPGRCGCAPGCAVCDGA